MFIYVKHYMNIMHMLLGILYQGESENIYQWKALGIYEKLWTCVKHLIYQDYISEPLKCIVETTCSIYNIRSYEIHSKMHINKYYNKYMHCLYIYHCKVLMWQCPTQENSN